MSIFEVMNLKTTLESAKAANPVVGVSPFYYRSLFDT